VAHVEDLWLNVGPNGRKTVKTARYGTKTKRWQAVWQEPGGKRRKKSFETKDAAQGWLDKVAADKQTGTYITRDSGAITVRAMSERWVEAHPDWAASTRARNLDILRSQVLPRWGDVRLDEVTNEDVQAWVNAMTCATNTTKRHHQVLSGILTLAVKRKRLPYNAALGVAFPAADGRPMIALTIPQVDAFVAAHPHYLRVWALFLAFTGLRVSEAAGLRIRDVDLMRRRVTVRESVVVVNGRKVEQTRLKTDAAQDRRVPLVPELVPLLDGLCADRSDRDRVFVSARGASINRANYSRREFRAAAEAIGMAGLRPHELRHTAVSHAIASGATVKEVQAIAGHSDASVTLNVYGHLFEDSLDQVSDRMGAHIERARKAARKAEKKAARPTESPQAAKA